MSREEAIKILLEPLPDEDINARLDRIEAMLELILTAIVIPQIDACEIAGITAATIRNMALRGEVDPMQKDGSKLNFYQLKQVKGLKPRRQVKRRKAKAK